MTVGELIKLLSAYDKGLLILTSLNDRHCGNTGSVDVMRTEVFDKKTESWIKVIEVAGCSKVYLDSFNN